MDNKTISQNAGNGNIQTGPVYRCPVCHKPVPRLIPYGAFGDGNGHLHDWGDHIAYLDLPNSCRRAGHPARVARIGGAVAPLVFPYDNSRRATTEECVAILRRALARIAQEVKPGEATLDPACPELSRRAVSIVYRLVAGVLPPERAIDEIGELCRAAVAGALVPQEPEFVFQEREVA